MSVLNVIYFATCNQCVEIPGARECAACKINLRLSKDITEIPVFKCFNSQQIYLEMDENQNSFIVGYLENPNILAAALLQSDAYQIAKERLINFNIKIISFQHKEEFQILCDVIPK